MRRNPIVLWCSVLLWACLWMTCLQGCDHQASSVHVRFLNHTPDAEVLEEASDLLGIEIIPADHASSAHITMTIVPERKPGGALESVSACVKVGWAYLDAESIAHEIGHGLGLAHTDRGLMHPTEVGGDNTLTDEEYDSATEQAWRLQEQCK